jgi:hypothetical protein
LGFIGVRPEETGAGLTLGCIDGSQNCTSRTIKNKRKSGLCRDPGVSLAAPGDDRSRADSVVWRQLIGLRAAEGLRDRYSVKQWPTARFRNAYAVSVEDFDPTRVNGAGNDYRAVLGTAPQHDGAFIWGRPGWITAGVEGRNLKLYLAWVPMPKVSTGNGFTWEPHYFAGLDENGRPLFTNDPTKAAALDLSGGADPTLEVYDLAGQLTVRWIPTLAKWVMFYGGGFPENPGLCVALNTDCSKLRRAGSAIRMRTSDHPWGPWSPPTDILVAGDPAQGPVLGSQYAPGGLLHHKDCKGVACAPNTLPPEISPVPHGVLYAPNVIEEWTEVRSDAVELYWNVSTWNPYRVVLMKTRLPRER